jgi:uncharacterized protein (DUF305 family)
MEKNNKSLVVGVAALIIGLILGYTTGVSKGNSSVATNDDIPSGMHMMPGGKMMGNGDDNTMSGMMNDMTASLNGKTGDKFDQAFITEMIVHHEGAVAMAEAALTRAQHEEIKQMAQDIISAQTREITQMKSWLQTWYNL